MAKDLLLTYCRYYKGGKENPYTFDSTPKRYFWDWEKVWYDETKSVEKEGGSDLLNRYLETFVRADINMPDDDVPVSLQAMLYCRFTDVLYGTKDGFLTWYNDAYLRQ